jgi:filamentous hemagglutinin
MYSAALAGASVAGMAKTGFHLASQWKTTVVSYKTLGLKKGYNWLDLGNKFEDHLAATKYATGDRLPEYFKTFDFFDKENGIAISAKTPDTRSDYYSNPAKIGGTIRGYIKETVNFEEYKLIGTSLTKDMIKGRKLELGIPTETSPIQRQHIMNFH